MKIKELEKKLMKKIGFVITIILLATFFFSCGQDKITEENTVIENPELVETPEEEKTEEPVELVGAFTNEDTTDIPDEAQAAFDKAYEAVKNVDIKLISYRGSQVVAGMKYKFLALVDGEEQEIIIYKDLEGDCSFFDLEIPGKN